VPRFRLLIAYEGTDFHGWQRQEPPGLPALRTAQGAITDAVADLFQVRVPVDGASRTDSGVHARGQVAAFTLAQTRIPHERLALALNTRLPRDIEVLEAALAPDSFDPVRDCLSKSYSYTLQHGTTAGGVATTRAGVFARRTTAHVRHPLDLAAMRSGASHMIGTHDFRAFAHHPEQRETTTRTVYGVTVTALDEGLVRFDVAGSGFLHHMVRIMVGTLVEVGRGHLAPAAIGDVIASRDRSRAGRTMPPEGLCLEWIHYGGRDGRAATFAAESPS
jgi:tRNA pseudouridine38-40 synthase